MCAVILSAPGSSYCVLVELPTSPSARSSACARIRSGGIGVITSAQRPRHNTSPDLSSYKSLPSVLRAEGLSLLDYLSIVRSTLLSMFQASAQVGDSRGASVTAGRLLQCLSEIGRITGELGRISNRG